jgi:hypothetical protein
MEVPMQEATTFTALRQHRSGASPMELPQLHLKHRQDPGTVALRVRAPG